jgi:ribosomal 50S subunit-recycling heat shock protein
MIIADALIEVGLVKSRGEARRLAAQGGIGVNGNRLSCSDEVDQSIISVLMDDNEVDFRVGKLRHATFVLRREVTG